MAEINASDYFKAGGNTVANLVGIQPEHDGAIYNAVSFYNDWEVASGVPADGGVYEFQKSRLKSEHNGGTIISPTVPWNGKSGTLAAFQSGTGESDVFGRGCWVAVNPAGLTGGGGGGGGGSTPIVLSASRALSNTDNGATLVYSGASDIVLTVPSGLAAAFSCTAVQNGAGKVSFTQGGGVGFDNVGSTRGSGTFATIVQVSANQYGFQNPVPNAPVTLIQSGIPFISYSSWTPGANGALTVAALPVAFPAAYVYFPLDGIGVGVPAGWYYTTFSSTTAGTVFNNRYTSGNPSIPASPTAFVTTAGTVTAQVTTAVPAIATTVPGGSIGPNGRIEVQALWQANNSANLKAFTAQYGGQNLLSTSVSGSNIMSEVETKALNTGVVNRQVTRFATINSQTGTPSYTTVDSSQDQALTLNHTLGTVATGDYLICLRFSATVLYWS